MALTSKANINASGDVFQTYLNKKVLENFEPELRFMSMGKQPVSQKGFGEVQWTRVKRIKKTASSSLLTEGVTGGDTDLRMETISVSSNQYGLYVTVSDILIDTAPVAIVRESAVVVGNALARIIDEVIQADLLANGTNVLFAGGVANRAALGAANVVTAKDLAKCKTFLNTKGARTYDDCYVGVAHPNVIYDLEQESGTGTFIDLNKYTSNVTKAFNGEIGKLFGVRLVSSAYIQTVTSTVEVYPTYIMGKDAYGVAKLQNMKTYKTPRAASDSDPLAQRVKIGAKVAFNSIILQQEALIRIESASSLAYTWG